MTRKLTLWAGRIGFGGLAAVMALAYGALLRGQFSYGLEYDESYLLRVIANIATGSGFVDDGVSFFSSGEPFHPFISTGPVMLLPSALVWIATDGNVAATRLVPIAFFLMYLVATSILFYRWRGRWAALAALAGPLLLPILMPDLTNRSVMPGRFVGEIAAAALLMTMAALLARRNLAWAGLAGGLAIQTKLTYLLPALVVLVTWLIGSWLAHQSLEPRSLVRLLPGLLLPTLLFEGYKLVSLGPSGYLHNLELTSDFTDVNTVSAADATYASFVKLGGLTQLVSGPGVVLAVVAVCVLVVLVLLGPSLKPTSQVASPAARNDDIALAAALAGALSVLIWWLLTSSHLGPRPAVPAFMLALSLLSAVMVVTALDIRDRAGGRLRIAAAALPVLAVAVLILCTAYQGVRIARNTTGVELRDNQREAAAVLIANTDELPIDEFWTNPEFGVLTDLPYQQGSRLDPSLLVFTSIRALTERGAADATLFADACGDVLFSSADVLVCRRPS
jgi:hypothetical protein